MDSSNHTDGSDRTGPFTLVFDPDCGFCTKSARWVEARWASEATGRAAAGAAVGSWSLDDDELAAMGLDRRRVLNEVCLVERDLAGRTTEVLGGADAVARALVHTTGWSHLVGKVLAAPGVRQLARLAYPVVARNRHRLPGATEACRMDAGPGAAD